MPAGHFSRRGPYTLSVGAPALLVPGREREKKRTAYMRSLEDFVATVILDDYDRAVVEPCNSVGSGCTGLEDITPSALDFASP